MNNVNLIELGEIPNTKIMKGMLLFNSRNENLQKFEKVKILKYINVRNLVTLGNTDDVDYSDLDLSKKYKDCDIQQGDIIVPLLARKEKGSALYIEKEPAEKCIYNESNLIIRINNNNINNRYISLVLDNLYQKWFNIPTAGAFPFRVTVRHLEKAIIPLPDISVQNEIVDKYTKAVEQLEEVDNKIQKLLRKGADM